MLARRVSLQLRKTRPAQHVQPARHSFIAKICTSRPSTTHSRRLPTTTNHPHTNAPPHLPPPPPPLVPSGDPWLWPDSQHLWLGAAAAAVRRRRQPRSGPQHAGAPSPTFFQPVLSGTPTNQPTSTLLPPNHSNPPRWACTTLTTARLDRAALRLCWWALASWRAGSS